MTYKLHILQGKQPRRIVHYKTVTRLVEDARNIKGECLLEAPCGSVINVDGLSAADMLQMLAFAAGEGSVLSRQYRQEFVAQLANIANINNKRITQHNVNMARAERAGLSSVGMRVLSPTLTPRKWFTWPSVGLGVLVILCVGLEFAISRAAQGWWPV